MYQVIIYRGKIFARDLVKLPSSDRERIIAILRKLINPFQLSLKLKKLKNYPVADYRVRSGNYRILFDINEERKEVIVFRALHRKDLY